MINFLNCLTAPTANPEDVQRIRDAIKNATSLQEVERLTRILKSGNIPENLNAENGNGKMNGKQAILKSFVIEIWVYFYR